MEPLLHALRHDPENRVIAAMVLLGLADTSVIARLYGIVAAMDDTERAEIQSILRFFGKNRERDVLVGGLKHNNRHVRRKTAAMLGQVAGGEVTGVLLRALENPDPGVRETAARILARKGDPATIPPIASLLFDVHRPVRATAMAALADIQTGVSPHLRSLYRTVDANRRVHIVEALGVINDPPAREILVAALADADAGVRRHAADVIGGIGGGFTGPLLPLLSDPDADVRAAAGRALDAIRYPGDEDRRIRDAATALCQKGIFFFLGRQHDRAIALYEEALVLDPACDMAWSLKGLVLGDLGSHAEALECFSRAYALHPSKAHARHLAEALCSLDRHEEAISRFDEALHCDPADPELWIGKGRAYCGTGRFDQAVRCFEQARELDPDDPRPARLARAARERAASFPRSGHRAASR
ncbi:MAG: tetratricopeptide repeat protein [Methanomicrobiales archaeon]|nr:tetratricopeptide repeat protein [Methanomicrobiales archaeon]